jgi:hypothetical protein
VVVASIYVNCKKRANKAFYDEYYKKMTFLQILIRNQKKIVNKFARIVCLELYTLFHNLESFVYFFGLLGGGIEDAVTHANYLRIIEKGRN